MNNTNDLNVLKELIIKSNAKMMTVFFVKKDGTIRKLYAKTGIKKHLSKNPNKRKVNKSNDNLISVYDCENKGYRSFNLDSVIELSYGNNIWKV